LVYCKAWEYRVKNVIDEVNFGESFTIATTTAAEVSISTGAGTTVGGGMQNTASNFFATVGGGFSNTASSSDATVGGGYNNTSSGSAATVGGGSARASSGAPRAADETSCRVDIAEATRRRPT
jgi:hypothetical protein